MWQTFQSQQQLQNSSSPFNATNSLRFHGQLQLFKLAVTILDGVVIRNSCYDDAHTASATDVPANTIEEGIRGLPPSSFEICFSAEPRNLRKRHANQHETAPQTMLKRTTKHLQTEPKTPYKNPINPTNTNRKAQLSPQKIFLHSS